MSILIKLNASKSIATIELNKPPVNSLNTELWQDLTDALRSIESQKSVRGLIIKSVLSRMVFTAGNDLMELYAPATTKEKYTHFWKLSNKFLADLYVTRLVTIACVKGACPAGGCGIAMCCDYRIMSTEGNIGLNEVNLGITVPFYWHALMARLISVEKATHLCQFGVMLSPKDAKAYGLIDEVLPASEIEILAVKKMEMLLMIPDSGRISVKQYSRSPFSKEWGDDRRLDKEAAGAWEMLSRPSTVKALDGVFARLNAKSKI